MSKKFKRLLLICMCVGIFTGLAGFILTDFKSDDESLEKEVSAPVLAPSVSAGGAILINSDDGKVIYEKNADKKLYPASTTKIMTAIVVFQTLEDTGTDLDSEVIIPKALSFILSIKVCKSPPQHIAKAVAASFPD